MNLTRKYFYYLDMKGKLFLEETKFKNYTTCFKDVNFLNFFFKHLQSNPFHEFRDKYPFMSKCMGEFNFLYSEDTPIVYFDLKNENLIYGGNLQHNFEPLKLALNKSNYRIYYPAKFGSYGLLTSDLMFQLNIQIDDDEAKFIYKDKEYEINHFI